MLSLAILFTDPQKPSNGLNNARVRAVRVSGLLFRVWV